MDRNISLEQAILMCRAGMITIAQAAEIVGVTPGVVRATAAIEDERRSRWPDDLGSEPNVPEVTWADESGPILPHSPEERALAQRYPFQLSDVRQLLVQTSDPREIKAVLDACMSMGVSLQIAGTSLVSMRAALQHIAAVFGP